MGIEALKILFLFFFLSSKYHRTGVGAAQTDKHAQITAMAAAATRLI